MEHGLNQQKKDSLKGILNKRNFFFQKYIPNKILLSLKRNQKDDYPLLVYYSLVGNDVCNGYLFRMYIEIIWNTKFLIQYRDQDTLAHMTKPQDFHDNILSTLKYLDDILPNGSHVLLTGLANGKT